MNITKKRLVQTEVQMLQRCYTSLIRLLPFAVSSCLHGQKIQEACSTDTPRQPPPPLLASSIATQATNPDAPTGVADPNSLTDTTRQQISPLLASNTDTSTALSDLDRKYSMQVVYKQLITCQDLLKKLALRINVLEDKICCLKNLFFSPPKPYPKDSPFSKDRKKDILSLLKSVKKLQKEKEQIKHQEETISSNITQIWPLSDELPQEQKEKALASVQALLKDSINHLENLHTLGTKCTTLECRMEEVIVGLIALYMPFTFLYNKFLNDFSSDFLYIYNLEMRYQALKAIKMPNMELPCDHCKQAAENFRSCKDKLNAIVQQYDTLMMLSYGRLTTEGYPNIQSIYEATCRAIARYILEYNLINCAQIQPAIHLLQNCPCQSANRPNQYEHASGGDLAMQHQQATPNPRSEVSSGSSQVYLWPAYLPSPSNGVSYLSSPSTQTGAEPDPDNDCETNPPSTSHSLTRKSVRVHPYIRPAH